jgi:hypothetical protein
MRRAGLKRRLGYFGALAVGIVLAVELACFVFWSQVASHRVPYHLYRDFATELRRDAPLDFLRLEVGFDPELGWYPIAGNAWFDEAGARRAPGAFPGTAKIAAYGDSFVFGAEVNEDETFPHYLGQLLHQTVPNHGVGGYGPDQAVLRLARHLREGRRWEKAILAMPSENIARVVNVFFSLYVPLADVTPAFVKPLFINDGASWRLASAVPPKLERTSDLLEALGFAREHDFWYLQNERRPRPGFPYLETTIQAVRFFGWEAARWQDLYRDQRALDTLAHVLDRFVALAEEFAFRPVYVVVPMPEDLLARRAHYDAFLEAMRSRFGDRLTVVDVGSDLAETDFERFHVKPFSGHPSPFGQLHTARAIGDSILRR